MKKYYDRFRQAPELVKLRMASYVHYFKGKGPIADLGCGRGEFLEILKLQDLEAVGVDSDPEMIEMCRNRGLNVVREDIFSFLKKGGTHNGIMASHIIEHLRADDARELLTLCHRSLFAGGRLIVITPNTGNLDVISSTFWLDPAHVRPYPLALLEEMFAEAGFNIISSGTDAATIDGMRLRMLRTTVAKLVLPLAGMKGLWGFLHSARDIYVVGEKVESRH